MRHPPRFLLATADPLLNERFAGMAGVLPVPLDCETPGECLDRAASEQAEWILLSPALSPVRGTLAPLVAELGASHSGLQRIVATAPGQLTNEELQAIRKAGGRVVALPERPVTNLKSWLRAEIALTETEAPSGGRERTPSTDVSEGTAPIPRATGELDTVGRQCNAVGAAELPTETAATARLDGLKEEPADTGSLRGHTVLISTPPRGEWPAGARWQPAAPASAPAWPPGPAATAAPASAPALAGGAVLRQRVVALWGGKPGTGRSTLLVALADLISRMPGVRVCAVDLNPLNSSLAPLLRKEAEPSSWWRLGECLLDGNLTPQALRESLVPMRPGWSLLSGPGGSEPWCSLLTPQVARDLMTMLRAEFDYILLDLPAGRGPVQDACLAQAQQILLTVSGFFPDVLDTARLFQQLVNDGLAARERCALILCPWLDSPELPAADVSGCLGLPVSGLVPLAPAAAMAAARTGRPVTQLGTEEAKAYAAAAATVAGLVTGRSLERPQRRSWFGH